MAADPTSALFAILALLLAVVATIALFAAGAWYPVGFLRLSDEEVAQHHRMSRSAKE